LPKCNHWVICWEYKRNRHYGERHETNRNCNLRDRPFHRRRCMRRQIAGRKRQGSASGRYAGLIESKRPFVLDPSLARAVERAASGSPCLPPFRVPVASAVRVKEKPRRQGRGKLDRGAKMEKSGPHYGANTGERLCNHSCTNIKTRYTAFPRQASFYWISTLYPPPCCGDRRADSAMPNRTRHYSSLRVDKTTKRGTFRGITKSKAARRIEL
jgi:hypothetical protein